MRRCQYGHQPAQSLRIEVTAWRYHRVSASILHRATAHSRLVSLRLVGGGGEGGEEGFTNSKRQEKSVLQKASNLELYY